MKTLITLLSLLSFQTALLAADQEITPHNMQNLSLRNEVQHAIDKGLAWLQTKQNPDGYWDQKEYPAMTALILTACEGDPSGKYKDSESVKKGYAYVLSCVHPDGGIYNKDELLNYNTSISMMALLATGDSKYDPVLRKARQFLLGQQITESGDGGNKAQAGGIGYGDDEPHSDMSNMVFALEALHYTAYLADKDGEKKGKDLNWDAAIDFIQRCQNLPGSKKTDLHSTDPKDKGGFVYAPDETQAATTKSADGKTIYHSYGSMSYAGMLSYIYAGLKKDDPRVTAVIDWVKNNYTMEENPGVGKQGLYYYYQTVAKALSTYGADRLKLADGKEVDWKNDLAKKLIDLQHEEGYWVNSDSGRHWEKDQILVTAYTVLALERVYQAQ